MKARNLIIYMVIAALIFQILQGQGLFRYSNRRNEGFDADPGVLDQLASTRVVTVGQAREERRQEQQQIQHDLRDLTEGGISVGM